MDDLISRQAALDAFGLSEKTRKWGGDHSGYDPMMLYEIQDVLEGLPSITPLPCEDAISRQAAIGIIQNWLNFEGYSWGEKNVMKCTISELMDLPSVTPSPKMGRWIEEFSGHLNKAYYKCSECGNELLTSNINAYRYCNLCGAKMEGVEE